MSHPSLTSEIFVYERERKNQEWTIQIHWQHGETRHRTKTNKQMKNQSETQKNRQTKTQSETQHRKTDEQIESEQTPRVTPSEWQAVPTSYKTTATLMI